VKVLRIHPIPRGYSRTAGYEFWNFVVVTDMPELASKARYRKSQTTNTL
jgi:hypothetical protein